MRESADRHAGSSLPMDRENACVFPSLPASSGSGPIQFVTVFVTGNRFLGFFACRGEANLLILLAAPQGFEPRYADPESAVLRFLFVPTFSLACL
jgi:hypothetical protein